MRQVRPVGTEWLVVHVRLAVVERGRSIAARNLCNGIRRLAGAPMRTAEGGVCSWAQPSTGCLDCYPRHDPLSQLEEWLTMAAVELSAGDLTSRTNALRLIDELAGQSPTSRQLCVDVLCAQIRRGGTADGHGSEDRRVSQAAIALIVRHLQEDAPQSWSDLDFDFRGANLVDASFTGAVFAGESVLFDGASFSGLLTLFNRVAFHVRRLSFARVEFGSAGTTFAHSVFAGHVLFESARFGGNVDFRGASFAGARTSFARATFAGVRTSFDEVTFPSAMVDFSGADFSSVRTTFDDCGFVGDQLSMTAARFVGRVSFDRTRFRGRTSFSRTVFAGARAYFEGACFVGLSTSFELTQFLARDVSFRNAAFNTCFCWRGLLGQGDVPKDEIAHGPARPLGVPRVAGTCNFDGLQCPYVCG